VRSAAKELGLERYCIPKNKLLIKRRRRGRRRRRFQCAKGQPGETSQWKTELDNDSLPNKQEHVFLKKTAQKMSANNQRKGNKDYASNSENEKKRRREAAQLMTTSTSQI
jgi:hypothetical protein